MNWIKHHRNELFIFGVLLCCYSYFLPRWASWNQNSRLDLVLAIVDEGTLSIDTYYQNTGDYAVFNGRHYSDKAPGAAFLAVPVYAVARPVLSSAPIQKVLYRLAEGEAFGATLKEEGSGLLVEKIYFALVLYLVTLAVVAIPSAALGVLIYRFLGIFTQRPMGRIAVALIYGLGTSAFPYSWAFFGHQTVAFILFYAFYLAFLIGHGQKSARWTVLVGFLLAYACITEYPTALIAGAIFIYALILWRNLRWIVALILSGLPPALLLMAYDWAIFGNLLPVGYLHSELYTDIHGQGFISLVGPSLSAMWGITFGSFRGLFFVAPILLLSIPGFIGWWRQKQHRAEWSVCLWAVMSFFLFNGSSIMWQGGFSIGPRYLLPMVPFMALGLGYFVCSWGARWWARVLIIGLGVWSFAVVWIETLGGQSFPDWTPNPLLNLSLPQVLAGNIARNLGMALRQPGYWSLLPLVVLLGILALCWRFLGGRSGSEAAVSPATIVLDGRTKELQTDG